MNRAEIHLAMADRQRRLLRLDAARLTAEAALADLGDLDRPQRLIDDRRRIRAFLDREKR